MMIVDYSVGIFTFLLIVVISNLFTENVFEKLLPTTCAQL